MIFGFSKTSVNGVLAFLIATLTTLLAFQIPPALATPNQTHVWLWATAIGNLLLALMRMWVGLLQNDSPPPPPPEPAQPKP